jgi:mannosyl-glycoprotein endo-beta-N-acetylglucosaminidase
LLQSKQQTQKIINQLVRVAKYYGFDGWFINLETKLRKEKIGDLMDFLRDLRTQLKKAVGESSLVIWYDSVTIDGDLKWQNCLNEKNKAYFDVCDGIFLNYNWNERLMKQSIQLAG